MSAKVCRVRDCVLSGLSFKTCPAWLDLPGARAPAGIALGISETHKLLHHNKVTAQVGERALLI